jgi:hypothetical protein
MISSGDRLDEALGVPSFLRAATAKSSGEDVHQEGGDSDYGYDDGDDGDGGGGENHEPSMPRETVEKTLVAGDTAHAHGPGYCTKASATPSARIAAAIESQTAAQNCSSRRSGRGSPFLLEPNTIQRERPAAHPFSGAMSTRTDDHAMNAAGTRKTTTMAPSLTEGGYPARREPGTEPCDKR